MKKKIDLSEAFKKLLENFLKSRKTILFENKNGVNENITFSKSPFNFKKLLIEFTDTVVFSSIEVLIETDKKFTLCIKTTDEKGNLYFYVTKYILTDKGVNILDNGYSSLTVAIDKNLYVGHINSIKITKVIGFE